jgi:Fe-S oxidoreductase
MPLPIGDTIGILADNLRLRGSVLPISARNATRWARGLGLPRGGATVLYTGLMFQLIPFIEEMSQAEQKLGDSWLAGYIGLGRQVNKLVNISAFMARPSAETRAAYDQVLVDVATLLKQAGVDFGYLYEDELYSGALIYDLGEDEVFRAHARKVYDSLKQHGVKNVITIDPHTTNMLRSVYPTVIDGYDLTVKSYLEVLALQGMAPVAALSGEVAIHDSCVFARYEGVVDEPRKLLGLTGLTVREPENAGKFTWCCGGPAESLYPQKAVANAAKRVEQLKDAAPDVVTMCPICFVNLQKAAGDAVRLHDISHYLRQGYVASQEVR